MFLYAKNVPATKSFMLTTVGKRTFLCGRTVDVFYRCKKKQNGYFLQRYAYIRVKNIDLIHLL